MPQQIINFLQGDTIASDIDYRDNLPVNMYAIKKDLFGAAGYMQQIGGLSLFSDTESGASRGGRWNARNNMHYRVQSSSFLSVDQQGAVTRLGTIEGLNNVNMPYSFNTQAIIGGGNFYLYDEENGFRRVVSSGVSTPISGTWLSGYYLLTDGDSLYHTLINDEDAIDPNSQATAEFSPDSILAVHATQDNFAAVFGRFSVEYFQAAPSNAEPNVVRGFAFQRIPGRAQAIGIVGTHAYVEDESNFYILGNREDESIGAHFITAGSSTKISSREVDKIFEQYTAGELSLANVEKVESQGTTYILYSLPRNSLLYNATIAQSVGVGKAWSELKTGGGAWRAINSVFDPRISSWVWGDTQNGFLGLWDDTIVTQYGESAPWELSTPFMYLEDTSIDEFSVEILPGFATTNDTNFTLSMTYDGLTETRPYTYNYGSRGDYDRRFIIYRLGYVRNWVSFILRGNSTNKMVFSRGVISFG